MGGSLAASIRKRFPRARVVGVSHTARKIARAKKRKLIHEGFSQLKPALRNAQFVVICSPVNIIPRFIAEVDRYAKLGTIVTDVGSTKSEIVRWAARRRFKKIQFIGSHPLAGSHLTGLDHARADLFKDALVFVTPDRASSRIAIRTVSSFWKKFHAQVRIISPEKHDQIVSQISHLPHAVASVLMNSVPSSSFPYRASGFMDTTRVAQGDPSLWVPIFLTNRKNLISDLRGFEKALRKLIALLDHKSESSLRRFLKAASLKRRSIG